MEIVQTIPHHHFTLDLEDQETEEDSIMNEEPRSSTWHKVGNVSWSTGFYVKTHLKEVWVQHQDQETMPLQRLDNP